MSYAYTLKFSLIICGHLLKLPIEIRNFILSFLRNGIIKYYFHVNITKKILKSIYFKKYKFNEYKNKNIETNIQITNNINYLQSKQFMQYNNFNYDADDDIDYNILNNKCISKKLSKNEYENNTIKTKYNNKLLLKKKKRIDTLKKKYSINFKGLNYEQPLYIKNDEIKTKNIDKRNVNVLDIHLTNIEDWNEVWTCIDSGEESCDSCGKYRYNDYYMRYYINKNDPKIIIKDDTEYSRSERYFVRNYIEELKFFNDSIKY